MNIVFVILSLILGFYSGNIIIGCSLKLLSKNIFSKLYYYYTYKKSFEYFFIKIVTFIIFFISYLRFGFSYNTIIFDLIVIDCLIMIMTDLKRYFVKNICLLFLLLLSTIFIIYNDFNIIYSIFSSFVYFFMIFIVKIITEKITKHNVIGSSDIKIISIFGLLLGIEYLPYFLFLSGIVGLFFGLFWKKFKKVEYFPFFPSLILSFFILFLL